MFGPNNSDDKDRSDSIQGLDDADFRSAVNGVINSVSEFVNTPQTREWNIGDLFRLSLSTDPFTGGSSVPSRREYSNCLDTGGRSVWAEDGLWRCLFPGQNLPQGLTHEFKDYTGFLDYQRDLVRRASLDRKLTGRENQSNDLFASELQRSNGVFPGSNRPRLISEEEAKGKQPISQSVSSESVTLDDGTLQTRTKEVRYFDDGTAFVKNTTNSREAKGWFWNSKK